MTIYGSMQCPYYVHRALAVVLGRAVSHVRVVQTETGGGFGGKEEYPSMIAAHAALLALKAGRPVKLIYDRVEDMVATTKRHPSIVRHRTGVTRDGRLIAMDVEVILDGGAYATLSPVVLSRGTIHAAVPTAATTSASRRARRSPTRRPTARSAGSARRRHSSPLEVHMERIAEALGIDPVRLREMQRAAGPGDTTATGQGLGEDCSALAGPDAPPFAGARLPSASERRYPGTRNGIGLALFFHGSGLHRRRRAEARVERVARAHRPGCAILVASTEIGQGTRTMHAQIVADTLGVPYEQIEVNAADTGVVPDSGPTVASRTCMVVGRILQRVRRGDERSRLGRLTPREYLPAARCARRHQEYERPDVDRVGRQQLPGRRVRPTAGAATSARSRSIPTPGRCGRFESRRSTRSARRSIRCSQRGKSRAAARRGSATRCSSAW